MARATQDRTPAARSDRPGSPSAAHVWRGPSGSWNGWSHTPRAALLIGFVAGSVFWHFVGFWDFVGQAVFHAPPAATVDTGRSDLTTGSIARIEEPVSQSVVRDCVTLVRASGTEEVTAAQCPPGSVPARVGPAIRRGDLASFITATAPAGLAPVKSEPAVAGWAAVTTEPSTGRSSPP